MKKICFIRFGPTSSTLGNRFDPWWFTQNGFEVFFWDISHLFFSDENIKNYYPSKQYKFQGPNHKIFYNYENFFSSLDSLDKNTIILYGNRNPFLHKKDNKIIEYLFSNFKFIIPIQFETNCLFQNFYKKIRQKIGLYKHYYHSKKYNFVANIGCGKIGRYYSNKIYLNSNFISIPSPSVIWKDTNEKIIKEKYILFVDQNFYYQPDAMLLSSKFCNNIDAYYDRMKKYFDFLENTTGFEIIIGCSGRYIFDDGFFNKRKIIYDKTLELIQKSELVLGHNSMALYQALISNKPILLLDDPDFTKLQTYGNIYMSNILNTKFYSNQLLNKDIYKKSVDRDPQLNKKIIKNYFFEGYQTQELRDFKHVLKNHFDRMIN